jgi:chromosome segregation ATPase
MNQGMDSTESTDIRRALERLHATLEDLSDRFRDLRRERRQAHEYILELERELEKAERNVSQQSEAGEAERERTAELLERIQQGERRHGELMARITELEQAVREREALVAEQEDLIQQYQARFDEAREFAARTDGARRELDSEVQRLREELELVRASESEAMTRARELEAAVQQGGRSADEVAGLLAQLTQTRQALEAIEAERGELVADHGRLADEFQALRQAERSASERLAELERQNVELAERDRIRATIIQELEERNRVLTSEAESLTARARDVETGQAEVERARLLEEELERSRAALAEREQQATSAQHQVDALREQLSLFEQQVGELRAERGAGEAGAGAVVLPEEERLAMIGQIESAIGVIDRYLGEP